MAHRNAVGRQRFARAAGQGWMLGLVAAFLVACAGTSSSQTKPERQSRAVKPTQAASTNSPSTAEPNAPGDSESARPEDRPFKGMKYRAIGPFRGGRSLTAAGIPGDPNIYYFGATGGGVWKSTDGATTWTSVFDKQGTSSIGSVAVSESDPNTIYVGTGEACIRGNIVGGNGVYKSIDAGKTWKFVGLGDTRAIGRLIVNPKNPDIAFVAALGHPFAANDERGRFLT